MRLQKLYFLTISVLLLACQGLGVNANTTKKDAAPMQSSTVTDENIDPARAKRATAIAKVEYIQLQGGSKYTWENVRILQVLKNASTRKLEGEISIAHPFQEPGIPKGVSIIYLVPYSDRPDSGWKLLSE